MVEEVGVYCVYIGLFCFSVSGVDGYFEDGEGVFFEVVVDSVSGVAVDVVEGVEDFFDVEGGEGHYFFCLEFEELFFVVVLEDVVECAGVEEDFCSLCLWELFEEFFHGAASSTVKSLLFVTLKSWRVAPQSSHPWA